MTSYSQAQQNALAPRESRFQRFADWVSDAMGRPTNIAFWAVLVTTWTCIFAFGGPHLASGTWLPAWFTSQGFNFPLNLVTTVAELFIGFLVATAANRAQTALTLLLAKIQTETDEIDTLVRENTDLTRQVHQMVARLDEVHDYVVALTKAAGLEVGTVPPRVKPPTTTAPTGEAGSANRSDS
jgi:low affinity Fe/Cu permease